MTITQYNEQINKLSIDNVNDPEIYNLLCRLTKNLLIKKIYLSELDLDAVVCTIAGDVWMKIISGCRFKHVSTYINKIYMRYVYDHLGIDKFEVMDITDDEILKSSYKSFGSFQNSYNFINNKVYIENINSVINQILEKSPYYRNTLSYVNLKLSLVISLCKDTEYFYHLNNFDQINMKLLITNFYSQIKGDLN